MRYVEWVVGIDIAVGVVPEVIEDMVLERVRGFHDEGIYVEPPEPTGISRELLASTPGPAERTIRRWGTRAGTAVWHPPSPSSRATRERTASSSPYPQCPGNTHVSRRISSCSLCCPFQWPTPADLSTPLLRRLGSRPV